jgi:hypothetical protein
MAFYFRNVPDFEYVSRFPGKRNLNDYVTVKNLFKRGKIRDDIFGNLKYFTKYDIIGDERPDNVAKNLYDDSTLDWVVLLSNNILNVYDEWPKTQYALDKYLLEKYGSYENLYSGIHHYETIEYKTANSITIVPNGTIVDEGFYKAPEYTLELDSDIELPTAIPGEQATASSAISNSSIVNLNLINAGTAYDDNVEVYIDPPLQGRVAIATAVLSTVLGEREVASVSIVDSGRGYTYQPLVSFTPPPPTIPPEFNVTIGTAGTVTSVSIGNSGDGYTFLPTLEFSYPEDIISNAIFLGEMPSQTINTGLEGMYISPDGDRMYTAHGASGYTQGRIEQYTLTVPWDITSASYVGTYNLTVGVSFTYATGVEFSPDGTRMYVSGLTSSGFKVAQYTLGNPWLLTSVTYKSNISTIGAAGVRFQDNGRFLYLLDGDSPDTIRKYSLAVAWDITTLSPIQVSSLNLSAITNDFSNLGFNFNDTGKDLFVGGLNTVYAFTLTTAWDITTASLLTSLDFSSKDLYPQDVFIDSARTRLIISGSSTRKAYGYNIDLQARGYVTLDGENIGSFVLTNPGGGYTVPPTITIQPPIPSRTTQGYALFADGTVNQIVITDPGYNYREPPQITIQPPLDPIPASGRAVVEDGVIIDLILSNPGRGYETAPQVTISPPGNIYEPQVDEVFEINGQLWKYNGFNWYRKISDGVQYYDIKERKVVEIEGRRVSKPVTNYEYEIELEERKRSIYVLKPDYISIVFDDIENLMAYKKGSEQYLSRTLKRADNPRYYD